MKNAILSAIQQRRSRREFTPQGVSDDELIELVRAGIWAPSGLNNQPWRFVIVTDGDLRQQLAATTKYGHIIKGAPALLVVFLAREDMYNEVKDHQAAGACIQNILLAAESLGLGAVWLGQILQHKDKVNNILGLDDELELMAVVAIGHPTHKNQQSTRKELAHFILKKL